MTGWWRWVPVSALLSVGVAGCAGRGSGAEGPLPVSQRGPTGIPAPREGGVAHRAMVDGGVPQHPVDSSESFDAATSLTSEEPTSEDSVLGCSAADFLTAYRRQVVAPSRGICRGCPTSTEVVEIASLAASARVEVAQRAHRANTCTETLVHVEAEHPDSDCGKGWLFPVVEQVGPKCCRDRPCSLETPTSYIYRFWAAIERRDLPAAKRFIHPKKGLKLFPEPSVGIPDLVVTRDTLEKVLQTPQDVFMRAPRVVHFEMTYCDNGFVNGSATCRLGAFERFDLVREGSEVYIVRYYDRAPM